MIGEVDAVPALTRRSLVEPPNPARGAAEVQYWLLRHDPEVAAFAECIICPTCTTQRGLRVPAAIRQAMTATSPRTYSVILKDTGAAKHAKQANRLHQLARGQRSR